MDEIGVNTLIATGGWNSLALGSPPFASTLGRRLCVNDMVGLPVDAVSHSLDTSGDIAIEISGNTIGFLCFCRALGDVNIGALTSNQMVAYLTEIPNGQFDTPFRFTNDYVVIQSKSVDDYERSLASSAGIWGGYIHRSPTTSARPTQVRTGCTTLIADPDIVLPTATHREMLERAIEAVHVFDRFLKLYHQLELIIDWYWVCRIKDLAAADLKGLGQLMKNVSKDEYNRFQLLLSECIPPGRVPSVANAMSRVLPFMSTAEAVFQEYGSQDNNPLKDDVRWRQALSLIKTGELVSQPLDKTKRISSKLTADQHDETLRRIAAYWIYRIRCSVAHSRLGEYVLTDVDIPFVLDFGEPLLNSVIVAVLSNPEIRRFATMYS